MKKGEELAMIVKNGKLEPFNNVMADFIKDETHEGQQFVLKVMTVTDKNLRTTLQNAAIHVYLKLLSSAMCEQGIDTLKLMEDTSHKSSLYPTKELLKEIMWRRIMKAMFDVDSTKKLSTIQVNKVYERIAQFVAENYGISIEFPREKKDDNN